MKNVPCVKTKIASPQWVSLKIGNPAATCRGLEMKRNREEEW
jgi:hypothetical protein